MRLTNSEIRAKARQALGGQIFAGPWLTALLISLAIGAILAAASGISYGIGSVLLTGPLYLGLNLAYLKLVRGEEMKFETAFAGCNDFGSNFVLGIMQSLLIFLWSLLCYIPGIIKGYAYSMAFFIKADHPEYGWRECLNESERMMNGHKMDYFLLQLSFIGWTIVGTLACGIGTLWVTAYISASNAVFYDELKKSEFEFSSEE